MENANNFSVILTSNNKRSFKIRKYSLLKAVKPLVYFTSIFGLKIIKYLKDDIRSVAVLNKVYSLAVILAISILTALIPPKSWRYTIADVPLNIMTKAYGSLHVIEVLYSILSISMIGNHLFVRLLKIFDEIDTSLRVAKKVFYFRGLLILVLILWPLAGVMVGTLYLRTFDVKDMSAYISIFMQILEGCILLFFAFNIYFNTILFNELLVREKVSNDERENTSAFKRGTYGFLQKCSEKKNPVCWLELMRIYDKIADSVYLFNEIYSIQILIMFIIWFMCTMLVICRYLSPSLPRSSGMLLSDIFLYTITNSRPIILAKICELLITERKKTQTILMNILLYEECGNLYFEQVQTMFQLVGSRKLHISAEVFTVNIPIILNFAGKAISYGVLIIQYFYMHN